MAYFPDLEEYDYLMAYARPGTKTVGWLERGHDFPRVPPQEDLLNRLWEFCKASVAVTRGGHSCPFCGNAHIEVERDGACLLLGTGEIRIFSPEGKIYASPTLIYHYVATHHYRPPDEFVDALFRGPRPDSPEYFLLLLDLDLKWERTSAGGQGYVDLRKIPDSEANTALIDLMNRNKRKKDK